KFLFSFNKPNYEIYSRIFVLDRHKFHLSSYAIIMEVNELGSIMTILTMMIKETLFFVSYVKQNTFTQTLSPSDEKKYLQLKENGDREARNKLIEHNLRLVAHIVKKFDNTGEQNEDLISIGTIGLIKGVESFKTGKGT